MFGRDSHFSISKSYKLTSEIVLDVITLEMRFSPPVSMSLVLIYQGDKSQKLVKLEERSGRLRPKILPNLDFLPHWKISRRGSVCDLGILVTRLYGDMCSLYV